MCVENHPLRLISYTNRIIPSACLEMHQRHAIFLYLKAHTDPSNINGLKRGVVQEAAKSFGCDRGTVSRFWRETCDKLASQNKSLDDVASDTLFFAGNGIQRRKGVCKYSRDELRKTVSALPFSQRQTIRELSSRIGVPTTTVHRMIWKEGFLRRISSHVKPVLTEENKVARVLYALDEVYPVARDGRYNYKDLYNCVDVDEKWFHLTKVTNNYILVAGDSDNDQEEEPTRRTRHKSHIDKILFLCAQARPRYDPGRKSVWDGKLGIWPIGEHVPAKRTTKCRTAGTLVWKNELVTKDVYRRLLLEKVVPAIMEKWPRGDFANPAKIIRIQQDGPNSHITPDDEQWNEELRKQGMENKILLFTQPANSPDLNINNLELF